MEQDQKLKELLLLGSEKASAHFTARLAERVQKLSSTPFYSQPLVSRGLRKAFLITVVALVGSIFLVCLLLASPEPSFPRWPVMQSMIIFTTENFYTILAYIICFWVLFATNTFVEKKRRRWASAAL